METPQTLTYSNVFLKRTDVFVASYPRSGNTWFRLMLADVILQMHGFQTDTELPIHSDHIIPDMYHNDANDIDPRIKLPCRLLMTHEHYSQLTGRAIYIFRNPADSLCSYYHLHRRYEHLRDTVPEDADTFCERHLTDWHHHLENYIQAKEHQKERILFISYEKMHERPAGIVKAALKFYGLDLEDDACRKAVEHHTFNKQRANEKLEGRFEYFFRKGKVDGAREELQAETIALIEQKTQGIYRRARQMEEEDYWHGSEYFRTPQELKRQFLYLNLLDTVDFLNYKRKRIARLQMLRRISTKLLLKLKNLNVKSIQP